ncbi:MviM Predicted dehydrogenases and related proteins [Spirosomataceae bacterium]
MGTLKAGIIGCGAVTQKSYISNLPRCGKIVISYLFDTNIEMALKAAKGTDIEAVSLNELKKKSDIIIIATPPSTHFELLKDVLVEGKMVICEKPFLTNAIEVQEVLEIAKKYNSQLYVAHFRRCFPTLKLANELISTNILGEVKGISIFEGGKFSWHTESGYVFSDKSGGVLYDTGSHSIDMALYVTSLDLQTISKVHINTITRDKVEPSHEIKAALKLELESNKAVDFNFMLSRYGVLSNKIKIECENGYLEIPIDMKNYIKIGRNDKFTILYTKEKYENLMDCFAIQFDEMLNDDINDKFKAYRFSNLVKILETVRDFESNIESLS